MEARGEGMKLPVTLLDYGVGNIHSLAKALERAGAEVRVAGDPGEARCLVLPGVGAFPKVAEMIEPFRNELRGKLEEGLPTMAICIGMQILYEGSEEGPGEGLAFLPGRVRRLRHRRLPHIGWNTVEHARTGPFADVEAATFFYFVHSFAASPCGEGCVATAEYGDRFAAAAVRANVWGVQFHPEKSSDAGRQVVRNFIAFAREHS